MTGADCEAVGQISFEVSYVGRCGALFYNGNGVICQLKTRICCRDHLDSLRIGVERLACFLVESGVVQRRIAFGIERGCNRCSGGSPYRCDGCCIEVEFGNFGELRPELTLFRDLPH